MSTTGTKIRNYHENLENKKREVQNLEDHLIHLYTRTEAWTRICALIKIHNDVPCHFLGVNDVLARQDPELKKGVKFGGDYVFTIALKKRACEFEINLRVPVELIEDYDFDEFNVWYDSLLAIPNKNSDIAAFILRLRKINGWSRAEYGLKVRSTQELVESYETGVYVFDEKTANYLLEPFGYKVHLDLVRIEKLCYAK